MCVLFPFPSIFNISRICPLLSIITANALIQAAILSHLCPYLVSENLLCMTPLQSVLYKEARAVLLHSNLITPILKAFHVSSIVLPIKTNF